VQNPANKIVAALEREWPRWQCWVVNRVVGGPVWCARRWDDHGQVLNAGSATELAERLEETAAGAED
jgi:hypothetical protein